MEITIASYALQTPPRVADAKPPGPTKPSLRLSYINARGLFQRFLEFKEIYGHAKADDGNQGPCVAKLASDHIVKHQSDWLSENDKVKIEVCGHCVIKQEGFSPLLQKCPLARALSI